MFTQRCHYVKGVLPRRKLFMRSCQVLLLENRHWKIATHSAGAELDEHPEKGKGKKLYFLNVLKLPSTNNDNIFLDTKKYYKAQIHYQRADETSDLELSPSIVNGIIYSREMPFLTVKILSKFKSLCGIIPKISYNLRIYYLKFNNDGVYINFLSQWFLKIIHEHLEIS